MGPPSFFVASCFMTATDPATHRRLEAAVRAHGTGRVQEAAAAYDELLRNDPGNADVMQRFGAALAELGRTEEGAQWMARSLELEPNRPTVLVNLARALHALGQHEAALGCCDRAASLDGTLAGAYRVRAGALTPPWAGATRRWQAAVKRCGSQCATPRRIWSSALL